MNAFPTSAESAEQVGSRSPADSRTILIVVAALVALVALAGLVDRAEPQPSPAHAVPSMTNQTVTGPVVFELDGAMFVTARGAETLGCAGGRLSERPTARTTIRLRCTAGARTGLITLRYFESAGDTTPWRIEHATDDFRMLSGAGLVVEAGTSLTGQIWFGEVEHTQPEDAGLIGRRAHPWPVWPRAAALHPGR